MQARIAILESAVDLPDTEEVPAADPGEQASVAMATGVTGGLRLGAVRNLIAGVPIAFAGHAVDAVGRDALFQLFHVQYHWFLHILIVCCCFGRP